MSPTRQAQKQSLRLNQLPAETLSEQVGAREDENRARSLHTTTHEKGFASIEEG